MEKYIKSSDLAEVMAELAFTALDYADKVIVETTTRKLIEDVTVTVVVRNSDTYARLAEQVYHIVPATKSPDEVVNETIFNALEQIEAARKQAEENTPSNNE
jgi:hypothetical protein